MAMHERLTTIHLLPSSNSSLGGFFASAAGFLPTAGGAFFERSGTGAAPLSSGFLWVICDGSTFFKPEVTAPPRLSSESRAAAPPAPPAAAPAALGADWKSAGGGGGGGGGPPAPAGAEGAEPEEGTEEGAGSP